MVYKAQHHVVIHNFSDLVFLFSVRTVVIMAYLIVISSSAYQQPFDFFSGVSISRCWKNTFLTNDDKSLLSQPILLLDEWVGVFMNTCRPIIPNCILLDGF